MARRNSNPGGNTNRNVNWINSTFWVFYVLVLASIRFTLFLVPFFPQEYAWTVVHVLLTLAQFYLFHWVRGTPFWGEESGKYDKLTFWEQIDSGVQYTANRKALTAIPVIVFLLACVEANWDHTVATLNLVFLALAVIPKTAVMHRVRIGGINDD